MKEIELSPAVRYRGVTALARRIRMSPTTVSQVLHGTRQPSRRVARKLRNAGVDLEAVRAGTEVAL